MNAEDAKKRIYVEITGKDGEAAAAFLARYSEQAERFADLMAKATMAWYELTPRAIENQRAAYVYNLIYCAITLHVQSMTLFLSGHILAAGNLSRQVIEAIATTLLSSGKSLHVLDRFVERKYSTPNAVRDLKNNCKVLRVNKDSLNALEVSQKFYHGHSHLSHLTVGSATSFAHNGFYVGASFDEGKVPAYDREVATRVGLAELFPNFVEAVTRNLNDWDDA